MTNTHCLSFQGNQSFISQMVPWNKHMPNVYVLDQAASRQKKRKKKRQNNVDVCMPFPCWRCWPEVLLPGWVWYPLVCVYSCTNQHCLASSDSFLKAKSSSLVPLFRPHVAWMVDYGPRSCSPCPEILAGEMDISKRILVLDTLFFIHFRDK